MDSHSQQKQMQRIQKQLNSVKTVLQENKLRINQVDIFKTKKLTTVNQPKNNPTSNLPSKSSFIINHTSNHNYNHNQQVRNRQYLSTKQHTDQKYDQAGQMQGKKIKYYGKKKNWQDQSTNAKIQKYLQDKIKTFYKYSSKTSNKNTWNIKQNTNNDDYDHKQYTNTNQYTTLDDDTKQQVVQQDNNKTNRFHDFQMKLPRLKPVAQKKTNRTDLIRSAIEQILSGMVLTKKEQRQKQLHQICNSVNVRVDDSFQLDNQNNRTLQTNQPTITAIDYQSHQQSTKQVDQQSSRQVDQQSSRQIDQQSSRQIDQQSDKQLNKQNNNQVNNQVNKESDDQVNKKQMNNQINKNIRCHKIQMKRQERRIKTERKMETNDSSEVNTSHFENYRFKIDESQDDQELEQYMEQQC